MAAVRRHVQIRQQTPEIILPLVVKALRVICWLLLTQGVFIKEERQGSQVWAGPHNMRGHPSLLLVCMGLATCLDTLPYEEQNQVLDIFLNPPEAQSFLVGRRRVPRANHWDLELLTPGNLERECQEERCSWEEAREYFEDNTLTERYWEGYTYNGKGGRGRVDVAGLAVGLTSGILLIVLAGLGAFWYLHYRRQRRLRVQETCQQEGVDQPWKSAAFQEASEGLTEDLLRNAGSRTVPLIHSGFRKSLGLFDSSSVCAWGSQGRRTRGLHDTRVSATHGYTHVPDHPVAEVPLPLAPPFLISGPASEWAVSFRNLDKT
ncbi:hypothetical protein U0070_023087 [Myodes glareolus]|uniref:Gla domain-containing protein n=1 Tax=Myodes glareolus TaxID=447135 RepID=A0AAW0HTG9_MYOGA